MSLQSVSDNKEKTLAEQIIVVVLFSLMMAGFIAFFFKQEQQISEAGFKTLANSFSAKLVSIRSQWLMDQKPNNVRVKIMQADASLQSSEVVLVPVNHKGWVNIDDTPLTCTKVWQWVMNTPLHFMSSPISAVEVNNAQAAALKVCRYSNAKGDFFEYDATIGKVTWGQKQLKNSE